MNKLKILSILPALVLCSCGAKKNKFAGTYQFRLGKSDGNHMEVTATITDDKDPKAEGYKIMNISGDLGDQFSIMTQIEELEDIIDDLVAEVEQSGTSEILPEGLDNLVDLLPKLITAVKEEVKALKTVAFFYKDSGYKHEKYGNRLELGTHAIADLLDSIKTKHPDLVEIIDTLASLLQITGLFDERMYILPEKSKYAFNAFVSKKGLTFQVPISKDDLNQQFIWYGYEANFLSEVTLPDNYMDKMPGVKGEKRFGTHPAREIRNNVVVRDEAAIVNDAFAYEFSNSPIFVSNDPTVMDQLARFALDDTSETTKLYMKFGAEFEAKTYTGYVTSERKEIELTIDANGLCAITPNGKEGLKKGFFDNKGTEFRFSEVVQDPFQFRDYNVVDVGLNKVEL